MKTNVITKSLPEPAFDPAAWLTRMEDFGYKVHYMEPGFYLEEPMERCGPLDEETALLDQFRQHKTAIKDHMRGSAFIAHHAHSLVPLAQRLDEAERQWEKAVAEQGEQVAAEEPRDRCRDIENEIIATPPQSMIDLVIKARHVEQIICDGWLASPKLTAVEDIAAQSLARDIERAAGIPAPQPTMQGARHLLDGIPLPGKLSNILRRTA